MRTGMGLESEPWPNSRRKNSMYWIPMDSTESRRKPLQSGNGFASRHWLPPSSTGDQPFDSSACITGYGYLRTRGYPPQPVGIAQTLPNTPSASTLKTRTGWNGADDAVVAKPTSSSKTRCGFHGSRATRRPAARPVPVIAGTGFGGYGILQDIKSQETLRNDGLLFVSVLVSIFYEATHTEEGHECRRAMVRRENEPQPPPYLCAAPRAIEKLKEMIEGEGGWGKVLDTLERGFVDVGVALHEVLADDCGAMREVRITDQLSLRCHKNPSCFRKLISTSLLFCASFASGIRKLFLGQPQRLSGGGGAAEDSTS
ncbi:hypothetical protein FB45DRAFT_1130970 [Roridomyces roridus]|uniref:Uncharacterized protein n=1 Tax=Roridomyces roridus TaxID=1738132 RepID=A0AAD7B197_9AGAR|nr:hypothetical protein FB45DRAFT_1130970 [Roridomyces roridus]